MEPAAKLLLAVERFAVDQFQNQRLAAGFHRSGRFRIHDFCIIGHRLFIDLH
jgi:hypothetical protein